MLTEEHLDMLTKFRVRAMGDKLREMVEDDSYDRYSFEERMEMLIGAGASARRDRKVAMIWQHFFGQGYERIRPASLNPAGVM